MIPQDTAWRRNDRRLLSVKFRGAEKDTGNQTPGACAVLHLRTKGLPAQAAGGGLRTLCEGSFRLVVEEWSELQRSRLG